MRCCQVHSFSMELGYFYTIAAGCFYSLWVEATPHPRNTIMLVLAVIEL